MRGGVPGRHEGGGAHPGAEGDGGGVRPRSPDVEEGPGGGRGGGRITRSGLKRPAATIEGSDFLGFWTDIRCCELRILVLSIGEADVNFHN